jgi:hypothetical protein
VKSSNYGNPLYFIASDHLLLLLGPNVLLITVHDIINLFATHRLTEFGRQQCRLTQEVKLVFYVLYLQYYCGDRKNVF